MRPVQCSVDMLDPQHFGFLNPDPQKKMQITGAGAKWQNIKILCSEIMLNKARFSFSNL